MNRVPVTLTGFCQSFVFGFSEHTCLTRFAGGESALLVALVAAAAAAVVVTTVVPKWWALGSCIICSLLISELLSAFPPLQLVPEMLASSSSSFLADRCSLTHRLLEL